MRGRVLSIIVVMLCLCAAAQAFSFDVNITPKDQTIRINESAHYTLTVTHDSPNSEFFEIYSPDVVWDISTDPPGDRLLKVEPGESKQTHLIVTPLYVKPGYYGVGLNIKHSASDTLAKEALMIGVVPEVDEKGLYSPSVHAEVKMEKRIDPRQPQKIYLSLKNQNRRNLDSLEVKLRSSLINKDISTSLGPLQEKTIEIDVDLDPNTPPQEDLLLATLFAKARDRVLQFDLPSTRFRVMPYGGIDEATTTDESFLLTTSTTTYTNGANTMRDTLLERNFTYVQSWFFQSTPDPVVKRVSGGYVYRWHVVLGPGESTTITIRSDHRRLFWLALVAIILVVLYYQFRSPLVVKKAALVVERQQGGVSQLKVLITIHNRTGRSVRSLIIKDKVPAIAQVVREHTVGSLKPEKVAHYDNGEALLKWELAHIDGKEERIISYMIRTKLHVLGTMQLPPAQVRYSFYGWERLTKSKVEKLYR